jgi:protein KRI1
LKKGDPRIYDPAFSLFEKREDKADGEQGSKAKKEKPLYLRDYERKMLLENGGHISSDEGMLLRR